MDPSYTEILERARRFCAYRERASSEMLRKLREWGAGQDEADAILTDLKNEHFLDDKRFAEAFVRGKFSIKKWGRLKIKAELGRKGITKQMISQAILVIDEDDYEATLKSLIDKKADSLEDPSSFAARQKIMKYAQSKGYETDLIMKCMR